MNSYNGFSGQERQVTWEHQKAMQKRGDIKWEGCACEMCGQFNMNVMPHLENYFEPEKFHALCIECHMNLHARYKAPLGWYKYLQNLRDGYKPKNWKNVNTFFNAKESKEIFKNPIEMPIFTASNYSDTKWFENLSVEPEDLRQTYIDLGKYSEHSIQENYEKYTLRKPKSTQGIIDFNTITDD